MPLYSFDVFSAGLAYVDEVQRECCDLPEADRYARELLTAAINRHQTGSRVGAVFSAFVHEDGVGIVLSLIVQPGGAVQVGWIKP